MENGSSSCQRWSLHGFQTCTGFDSKHEVLFLCHIFTQRPMNWRKIERSNGRCLGWQQILANSIEISFHFEKSDLLLPKIYNALKPCLLLNWVSIARVVACFPQASLQRLPQQCPWLGSALAALCLCVCPICASRAGERPQELGRWFLPLNLLLSSGTAFRHIARWPAGAQIWTWNCLTNAL